MKLVTNVDTPWACLKDPSSNLIYWIHSKCACSFYKKIFLHLNWTYTTTKDIDWDKNIVFSFIRNPLTKHRVGIIEWFYFVSKQNLLKTNFDNQDFFEMLSQIVYLDHHSMSIKEHLGIDKASKIIWIPMDDPNTNHVEETIKLIEAHSSLTPESKSWIKQHQPVYVSNGFKKMCNSKILEIPPSPLIIKSLEYDQILYDKSTRKNFEPAGYPDRILKLKNKGMTQQQAEQQTDAEVESGEYLNWK